jgi:arginine deiminase
VLSAELGHVTTDIGRLERVLVHRPGPEIYKVLVLAPSEHPALPVDLMGGAAIEQHERFVGILRCQGVEVVFLEDVLDQAIVRARAEGTFRPWLKKHLPSHAHELLERKGELTARALLGVEDEFFYRTDPAGRFLPLLDPLKWMFYTRDFSVMTPRGVVICNFANLDRAFEAPLARFVFEQALPEYPVVFDALEEQVYVQGGDVMVASEDLLLVGVGNLTEERAARRLAQKLHMNVVAVGMPGGGTLSPGHVYDPWTALNLQFLHLDTIFTLIDTDAVLTLPYFLETRYSGSDPLTKILEGLSRAPGIKEEQIRSVITQLQGVGWVTLYKAGSGEVDPSVQGMKLVDLLRAVGYRVYYVGGDPGGISEFKLMIERVLRELRFQAANVLPVEPGKLIAYGGNSHTLAMLRSAKINVWTFPGNELVRWNGGPHCMAMPLQRSRANALAEDLVRKQERQHLDDPAVGII